MNVWWCDTHGSGRDYWAEDDQKCDAVMALPYGSDPCQWRPVYLISESIWWCEHYQTGAIHRIDMCAPEFPGEEERMHHTKCGWRILLDYK